MAVGSVWDPRSKLFDSFLTELETWTFLPIYMTQEAKQDSLDGSKAEPVGRDRRK